MAYFVIKAGGCLKINGKVPGICDPGIMAKAPAGYQNRLIIGQII